MSAISIRPLLSLGKAAHFSRVGPRYFVQQTHKHYFTPNKLATMSLATAATHQQKLSDAVKEDHQEVHPFLLSPHLFWCTALINSALDVSIL